MKKTKSCSLPSSFEQQLQEEREEKKLIKKLMKKKKTDTYMDLDKAIKEIKRLARRNEKSKSFSNKK